MASLAQLSKDKVLVFRYRSSSSGERYRAVRPVKVENGYMTGWCFHGEKIKKFLLNKMQRTTLVDMRNVPTRLGQVELEQLILNEEEEWPTL